MLNRTSLKILVLASISELVSFSLCSLITGTSLQKANSEMIDMSLYGQQMTLLAKNLINMNITYLSRMNASSYAQSSSGSISSVLTSISQIYGVNPLGIYYYLLTGDADGTNHLVVVYDKFNFSQIYSWLEPHYNGLFMIMGEDHNTAYSVTQYASNFQTKRINLPTQLSTASTNSSVGIAKSLTFQFDLQRVIVVASSTGALNQQATVLIYNTSLGLQTTITHQYPLNQTMTNAVSNLYLAIAAGSVVTLYDILTGAFMWNTTLPGTVIELQIKSKWVLALAVGTLWQIGPGGLVMVNATIMSTNLKLGMIIDIMGPRAIAWGIGITAFDTFYIDDVYPCDSNIGCACIASYCFTTPACITCNNTGLPCVYFPASNIQSTGYCFLRDQKGTCTIFCDLSCGSCVNDSSLCLTCRSQYYQLSDGQCRASDQFKILATCLSLLNTLKITGVQSLYLFVDRIELYNYHPNNYTGTLQSVFYFVDYIKQYFWVVISLESVKSWLEQPIYLPSYMGYTPTKFQQVERKDALFIQNTKDYFLVYVPLTVLIFLVLNRIFHITRQKYVSLYFRVYSFWPQLWLIIVVQNISTLWYYCFNQLLMTFSYNTLMRGIRMVTIPLIGLLFIVSVAYFFLTSYLYGPLNKYFTINMKKSKVCSLLMLLRYVGRPMIEATLTCLLNGTSSIMIGLTALSCCTLLVMVGFQLKFNVFKSKCAFASECVVQFLMILLNCLILLKYELYPELELLEDCILITVYLLGLVLILLIIFSNISGITQSKIWLLCCNFKRKKKKTIHFVNQNKKSRGVIEVQVLNEDASLKLNQCIKLQNYRKAKQTARKRKFVIINDTQS